MGRSIYISTESDDTQVLPDSLPNFKYPPFLGLIVNKQSSGTAKASCLDSIMYVVSAATGALATLALLSWVISFLINPDNPLLGGTSLALAPVIAIFGAFGWAGGMSFKADPGLRANLRKIGIAYTMTAFFLVIMGMLVTCHRSSGSRSYRVLLSRRTIRRVNFSWRLQLWHRYVEIDKQRSRVMEVS